MKASEGLAEEREKISKLIYHQDRRRRPAWSSHLAVSSQKSQSLSPENPKKNPHKHSL